jgi:RNA polymerase sigma factor (sigma-70 family)
MIEREEIAEQIRAAVAALPERAREVLTLRWDHSMSYADIATTLGIHPHSAKQQQSRAIAALKRRLSGILLPGS